MSNKKTKTVEPFKFTDADKMLDAIDQTDDYDRWCNHDNLLSDKGLYVNPFDDKPKAVLTSINAWIDSLNTPFYILQIFDEPGCKKDQNGDDVIKGFILQAIDYSQINDLNTVSNAVVSEFNYCEDVSSVQAKRFNSVVKGIKDLLSKRATLTQGAFFEGADIDNYISDSDDNVETGPAAVCSGYIDLKAAKAAGCIIRINKQYKPEDPYGASSTQPKKLEPIGLYSIGVTYSTKNDKGKKISRYLQKLATGLTPQYLLEMSGSRPDIINKKRAERFMKEYLTSK
jgi:hypothetical protein